MNFYLIEDDAATRRMLERILTEDGAGVVIGSSSCGSQVSLDDVRDADIILIDLLMPDQDGIETIRLLRAQGFTGRFVMISQVENKEMVEEAYRSGVEYFIHKPINRLEILSVCKRVSEYLSLQQSISSIRRSLSALDELAAISPTGALLPVERTFESQAFDLLARLGIAGEAGAADLRNLLHYLYRQETEEGLRGHEIPMLKDLYQAVLRRDNPALSGPELLREVKAMEQRVRRTVLQTLGHLASIGLTDYTNPTFEHFAQRLFDFQEVRMRMREIKNGEKTTQCRLNIKKFITALYAEAKAARNGTPF